MTTNTIDPSLIEQIATPQQRDTPAAAKTASVDRASDQASLKFPDIRIYRGYSAPVRPSTSRS